MLKIKLSRYGRKKTPSYRVIVIEARSKRDGKYVDLLGYYNPLTNPVTLSIDKEKASLWIQRGAQPTDTVAYLLKKDNHVPGITDEGKAPQGSTKKKKTKKDRAREQAAKEEAEKKAAEEAEAAKQAEAKAAEEAEAAKQAEAAPEEAAPTTEATETTEESSSESTEAKKD